MKLNDIIEYNKNSRTHYDIYPLANAHSLLNNEHPDMYVITKSYNCKGKYMLAGYHDNGSILMTGFSNKNRFMNCDKRFKENGYMTRIIVEIKED